MSIALLTGEARLTLACAALLFAALAFFLRWRKAREGWLVAATMLAGTAVLALAGELLVGLALELRHVMREPNHVAILVDDSRSMDLAEQAHGETRAERAAKLVAASAGTFERWRERHIVDFYTFSEAIQPTSAAALSAPAPT